MVHDGKNLKGRSNDAIASACLYIACRQEGVPRTFKEICAVSKISKKEIGRCFKLILKALDTSVELITTGDFMSRFCSNLGLPNTVQKAATAIARAAVDLDIVPGRSPISVAAAAIYMASQVTSKQLFIIASRHCFQKRRTKMQFLITLVGVRGKAIPERNRRCCWSSRCYHPSIIQVDVSSSWRTISKRL